MKTKYTILTLVLIALFCIFGANAQDLGNIELPSLPSMSKPVQQMTRTELQQKIQEIVSVIQQLQAILANLSPTQGGIQGIPSGFSFLGTMKEGMSSDNIKYLQIVLNSDPETRIADSGWGSPAKETIFYGAKTTDAVRRLQVKYRSQISETAGYQIQATGYAGPATIAKLNQILAEKRTATTGGSSSPGPTCGDSAIQEGEVCDKANLNSNTCQSRGYQSGTLSCSSDCLTFNTSNCQRTTAGGSTTSNRAPIITPIGNKIISKNNTISFSVSAQDPDGTTNLSYAVSPLPQGASFSNRNFRWTPSQAGTYSITFTVSDGKLADSETVTLTVSSSSISNSAPSAQSQSLTTDEDSPLNIVLSATDENSDSLSYTILSQPSHGTLSGTAPNLTYTPSSNYSGQDSFTFKAKDGILDSNTATITITVGEVNDAPVLSAVGAKQGSEGQQISFTVQASDIDSPSLTYSAQNRPQGSTFSNRIFSWTPSSAQAGTYTITFTVSDGELLDSETITITVADVPSACTPATCLGLGKNCGTVSDGCGGSLNCGSCGTGYTCQSNVCVMNTPLLPPPSTSCNTDSNCIGNGPGFFCNTTKKCEWKAPIGIPKPSFGIEETYRIYDDPARRNLELVYHQNSEGGYYTHYVDNTKVHSTDSNNLYGTEDIPRKTVPANLPLGSVVEIHGGPYTFGNVSGGYGQPWFSGRGTANQPIFIRGAGISKPVLTKMKPRVGASYMIIENLEFIDGTIGLNYTVLSDHVSFRNLEIHGGPPMYTTALGLGQGKDAVAYNNYIYNNGDPNWYDENDFHGVGAGYRDGNYAERLWIVDNHMHNNGGDSVQINSGVNAPIESVARYIYIGRNLMHEEGENAVDLKQCADVIVSENIMYDFDPSNFLHSGSDGTPMVVNGDIPKEKIWVIFNKIYDSRNAIRSEEDSYIIGNKIYNIQDYGVITWPAKALYIVGNTMHNVGKGIDHSGGGLGKAIYVYDNIISLSNTGTYHIRVGSSVATNSLVSHNIFNSASGKAIIYWGSSTGINLTQFQTATGQGQGCFEGDPIFVNPASYNLSLQSASFAIDSGMCSGIVQDVYNEFSSRYGIDIRKDIEERARPQGSAWDIGSYEYSGSASSCPGTDISCGSWPNCSNCNAMDGCSGTTYRDYYCSGNSCNYTSSSNDPRCGACIPSTCLSLGKNCGTVSDGCGGTLSCGTCQTDYTCSSNVCVQNTQCVSGQTQSCSTGLQGICSSGVQTCQTNGTWGSCIQSTQSSSEVCNDNLDNDCDGITDCSDSDCSSNPACLTPSGLPSGYVAYWRFENNANDETGPNNGVLASDASYFNDSQKGNVLSLDGLTAGATVSNPNWNFNELTISSWIKPALLASGIDYILYAGGSYAMTFRIRWDQANTQFIYGDGINSHYGNILDLPPAGQWSHRAVTFLDGVIEVYENGVSVGKANRTDLNSVSLGDLQIGMNWEGLLDDVMVYNRALSGSEIQQIYNAQKPSSIASEGLSGIASLLDAIQEAINRLKSLFW